MADSAHTIELLNALAVRLRDHVDGIRNPPAKAKLGADLETAADIASTMAHCRICCRRNRRIVAGRKLRPKRTA